MPELPLARRLLAEAVGTAFLIVAVVGSGIMASRLSADVGLQLLENAAATAGALIGLILMFGSVSGAHFNPVVTLVDRLQGAITTRDAALYAMAQTFGGCVGTVLANLMFELPAIELSTKTRTGGALWLSEVVATVGLLLVIHGCVRSGRREVVPFAVGAWIGGAYWFTSSTSFANPAVTVARMLSDSFAGIRPASAPMFVLMQLVGAGVGYCLIRVFYPCPVPATAPASERPHRRPGVLFLCVHNAGRSQMAAGWMRHLGGEAVVVHSGGSEPAATINPQAVTAMAEVGIDISAERPKRWSPGVGAVDVVVTMGCGDACPIVPGARYEDWPLADPAGQDLATVRSIRDQIRLEVETLLRSLGIAAGGTVERGRPST